MNQFSSDGIAICYVLPILFSYNGENRPESKATCVLHPVRRVATPFRTSYNIVCSSSLGGGTAREVCILLKQVSYRTDALPITQATVSKGNKVQNKTLACLQSVKLDEFDVWRVGALRTVVQQSRRVLRVSCCNARLWRQTSSTRSASVAWHHRWLWRGEFFVLCCWDLWMKTDVDGICAWDCRVLVNESGVVRDCLHVL